MTLQKQTVGVPLLGLNTLADPKSAAAGEFDLVQNMTFNRTARGGAELRKRFGGAALTTTKFGGGSIISGARLATFGDQRLMVGSAGTPADTGSLHSYSTQAALWRNNSITATNQAAVPAIGITSEPIAEYSLTSTSPDVAVSPDGKLMCVVWGGGSLVGNSVYLSVLDVATGQQLLSAYPFTQLATTVGWVRVIALSTRFMILTASLTAGHLDAISVTYSNPTGGVASSGTVATNLNASCKADVIKNGSNDSVLIAYHSTVPDTKIIIWNSNMTSGGSTSNAEIPSQAIGWVNWDFSDGNGYLAFVSAATGAKVFTVAQAGPAVSATTTMDATVTAAANVTGYRTAAAAQFNVFIEVRAAATFNVLLRRWPGSGTAAAVFQRSVGLAATCCLVNGRYYLPCVYESSLQAGNYLLDVSSDNASSGPVVAARALYGQAGGLPSNGAMGAVASITSTVAGWAALRLVQNPAGTKSFGVTLLRLDVAAKSISAAKRLGENLHISGGAARVYDGITVTEMGFYLFPETPTPTQAAAGSLTALGSYQYCAVYAWADSRGQRHRSAPSPIASITLTGANQTVSVTIPTLRLTGKQDATTGGSVFIELYRTVAGGTTFYRTLFNGSSDQLSNGVTVDTVTWTDNSSDATISANDILYTTGKVLPRIGPPSARLMEVWRNRLFLAGTENPNELWVSNEYSFGLGGVSFSDALVVQMETDGGPITALCEMDDRLVIFKRNSIYVLAGNGPTLTGDNPFQQPTKLTSVVGAVEQRGVVKTRDGVMFKSTRGIYLLGHGGQIIYAGAGVDLQNSLTVTGACVVEDEEQVRWTTVEGITLVYHYGFPAEDGIGRWTTFTNQAAVDCIVWNGVFVYLKSDGTAVEETPNAYSDPGATTITAKVRLAWLNLTQFFGRFKLYGLSLLCDFRASFTMTHRIAYDYDSVVAESETKACTVATLPPLQLNPARRRAIAIQPTLEETSTTEGFRASGWGLEVGVEPGGAKQGLGQFLT